METVTNAGLSVTVTETTPICVGGTITNHTFIFTGPLGNCPMIGLWSSVIQGDSIISTNNPTSFDSDDVTIDALSMIASTHGRNDNVKICNGIGKYS